MRSLRRSKDRGIGEQKYHIAIIKRAAEGKGSEAGRSLMKRKKSARPRTDPCKIPRRTRNERFCDFEKPRKRAYWKGKIDNNEQSLREASRNMFLEKSGMPDRAETSKVVDRRKNCPRARLGFVKPIRYEPKKI